MTEEMTKLEALQNKIGNICDENALTYRFHREGYPIQLVIRPDESPSGQLTMLENAGQCDTGYIGQDASIVFRFVGGDLEYQMSDKFEISEALFNKIKNLFKKMHSLWLQHFHCEVTRGNLLAVKAWPAINYEAKKNDDADSENDQGEITDENAESDNDGDGLPDDDDASFYLEEATKIVREAGSATTSLLQRKLKLSFRLASDVMYALEAAGVVGPYNGGEQRTVLPYEVNGDAANA
jgi:hypothetical protein